MTDAPGYRATPAALHEAADGIDDLVGELGTLTTAGRASAGRGLGGMAPDAEQIGHGELASALETFCTRWDWGVRGLVQDSSDMADGLRASVRAYEHTEGEVGSTFATLLDAGVGDPRGEPGQAPRPEPDGAAPAEPWTALGRDAVATTRDRIARALAGQNPFRPELDELGRIAE